MKKRFKIKLIKKYFILSITLIFLVATALSLYHLGIEQGFIKESLVCELNSGSNLLSKEDILKQLQQKNVSCQDVTFKIFGLSLTSYNIIISLIICTLTAKIYPRSTITLEFQYLKVLKLDLVYIQRSTA